MKKCNTKRYDIQKHQLHHHHDHNSPYETEWLHAASVLSGYDKVHLKLNESTNQSLTLMPPSHGRLLGIFSLYWGNGSRPTLVKVTRSSFHPALQRSDTNRTRPGISGIQTVRCRSLQSRMKTHNQGRQVARLGANLPRILEKYRSKEWRKRKTTAGRFSFRFGICHSSPI